jgi:hypothetical protein
MPRRTSGCDLPAEERHFTALAAIKAVRNNRGLAVLVVLQGFGADHKEEAND